MNESVLNVLTAAVEQNASDIHFSVGRPPIIRIDGALLEMPGWPALEAASCKSMLYSLLGDQQRGRLEEELELDCSLAISGLGRFRMNTLYQRGCVEGVLRAVPATVPSPESLGLGPAAMELAELPRGLVLVTGPTGAGKTTTLACLVEHINATSRKHILTIEDPIEFVFPSRLGLIRQREVGQDTKSFAQALRRALREDPDVILIGEMRDPETIALALTAAETGHLCLSTLHTVDSVQSIDRIIDAFPDHRQPQVRGQLAGTLKGVLSQTLLPRRSGVGRIAARELMRVNSAIGNLMRESKTYMIPNVIETSGALGMYTLDRSLAALVSRDLVTLEDAMERATDPERLALTCRRTAVAA